MPTADRACRPGVPEDLDHEVGEAVDHFRLVGEVVGALHHAEDLHDPPHAVESCRLSSRTVARRLSPVRRAAS